MLGGGGLPTNNPLSTTVPLNWQFTPSNGPPPPFLPPQMPPPVMDIPVDDEIQEQAFSFFSKFCKASALYVLQKAPALDLYRKLYTGEIGLREWRKTRRDGDTSQSRKKVENGDLESLSNYVYPIAPNINTLAHSIFLQIFSGPEWFTISSESTYLPKNTASDIPTAYKLQFLLKDLLHKGDIETTTLQALVNTIIYGTCCAKVNWFTYSVKRLMLSPNGPQIIPDNIYSCPTISPIPLNLWLPDYTATTTDVQRWRAIGHRTIRPFWDVIDGFENGNYQFNRDKFEERFRDAGGVQTGFDSFGGMDHDVDADPHTEDNLSLVKLWEVHGRFPTKYGLLEGTATIATEVNSMDPESGVLIRLSTSPATECGLRPFVLIHYSEQPGPFGMGMIEENEDNLYTASQFMCQVQDLARYTASAARMIRTGSSTERWILENGRIKPGDSIPFDNIGDIQDVPNPNSDLSVINVARSDVFQILEKETGVTNTFAGVASSGRMTATHASILEQQSQTPATARGMLFASKFIERAWNLALSLVSQYTTREKQIIIRNYDGQDEPVTVSPEEIRASKWKVTPAITAQDSMSVAKAQSIERIMGMAVNLKQVMQSEGRNLSISELMQRYFDYLKCGNTDRIVQVMGSQEMMLIQQNQQLQLQAQQMMEEINRLQSQGPKTTKVEYDNVDKGNEKEPDEPKPLVENGGPMGQEPTDRNAMAQFLQQQAAMNQGGR